jgi:large subunit ribosomal protein L10
MALKADPTTPQVAKKAAVIDEIKGKLQDADAAVLTEYRGLTVTDIANLRAALRGADTEYKIYKNTLVLRAANEAGVGEQIGELLTGPVAIAFVQGDAAAAAKALRDFAKTNQNLVLKGGLLGDRAIGTADVEALAELPSRDVLLSQIAGLFEAPLAQTAGLLAAVLRDMAGLVQALVEQRVAGGEAAPVETAPEPEAAPETQVEVATEATDEVTEVAPAASDEPASDEPGAEPADAPEPAPESDAPEAGE